MKTCCYPVVSIHGFKAIYLYIHVYVFPLNSFVCGGLNHLRYLIKKKSLCKLKTKIINKPIN